MCGIGGIIGKYSETEVNVLLQGLEHRGPDARGLFKDEYISLVHRRLSVIDLTEQANQPFHFQNLVIVFNGEIYNYKELRHILEQKGYNFITNSDTEVLIKSYHFWGNSVLEKLIGMFAFAIYNKVSNSLFLSRDRLGIKPIYYGWSEDRFYFASELKALQKAGVCGNIDNHSLGEYLMFGYLPSNNTIFSEFKKLEPGHFMTYHDGEIQTTCYWKIDELKMDPLVDQGDRIMADQLEEILISSFNYSMVSDVPVGIFFSGGLDSSTLLAVLSKHYGQQNTFTIGFNEDEFSEVPYAKKISSYFGSNHHEEILSLDRAKELLLDFYQIYDEPFYDSSGIPTSLVASVAKENGCKVVLSSEGGDELFAGYPSYEKYYNLGLQTFSAPSFRKGVIKHGIGYAKQIFSSLGLQVLADKASKVDIFLNSSSWTDYYLNTLASTNGTNLESQIDGFKYNSGLFDLKNEGTHPIETFMLWDLKYLMPNDFLLKIDRATMFHSVEGREPFLDHRLIEFALRLPFHYKFRDGKTKFLLREVLKRYIPESYFERPKMGFSIPLFQWFKSDLDNMIKTKLGEEVFCKYWPQISSKWVSQERRKYERLKNVGRQDNLLLIWKLLNLVLWKEAYTE